MGSIRRSKTKRRTRDLDQVHADLRSPKHLAKHTSAKAAEDLPGLGRYYCVECAKWFEGDAGLVHHRKGKNHKRRVRMLRAEPYSQQEAEAAVGLGVDNRQRTVRQPEATAEEAADIPQEMEIEA